MRREKERRSTACRDFGTDAANNDPHNEVNRKRQAALGGGRKVEIGNESGEDCELFFVGRKGINYSLRGAKV